MCTRSNHFPTQELLPWICSATTKMISTRERGLILGQGRPHALDIHVHVRSINHCTTPTASRATGYRPCGLRTYVQSQPESSGRTAQREQMNRGCNIKHIHVHCIPLPVCQHMYRSRCMHTLTCI